MFSRSCGGEKRVSLIAPDNIFALGGLIFGLSCLGFWADNHRIARKVSGVVFVITIGLILSNIGITPLTSPTYDFIGKYLVPLAIPLLLFRANLRKVFVEGGFVLPIFFIGALGVCVGAILGFFIFHLGEIGAKVAGIYTGAWIGGVVNFVAISQVVELTPEQFSVAISASSPVSVLGLIVLAALPSLAIVQKYIPYKNPTNLPSDGVSNQDESQKPKFNALHITTVLTLSFFICDFSTRLAEWVGFGHYSIFFITLVTVVLANLAPKFFSRFEGDFQLGMVLMYMFFAVIGSSTDALAFVSLAPIFFVFGLFIIFTHFIILLLCAKLFKFDLAETVVASAAAIVGPAPAAAIAASNGWKNLITPAVTIGILGYVIANFVGIAVYRLLALTL